jgi:hypothetical protein
MCVDYSRSAGLAVLRREVYALPRHNHLGLDAFSNWPSGDHRRSLGHTRLKTINRADQILQSLWTGGGF